MLCPFLNEQLQFAKGWVHLKWVLGFACCWAASQAAWVYSGYHNDYAVLTMKDANSLWLCLGASGAVVLLFLGLQMLLAIKPSAVAAAVATKATTTTATTAAAASLTTRAPHSPR
jgi:hypothetical protein